MNETTSVIIVDDEEPASKLLRNYLAGFPSMLLMAEGRNGVEAISLINTLRPDLVFLDIQMPGKNGFEVVEELEHLPKIIFTTAYDEYALQAFNVNATDYLLKPYTLVRFRQALEKALDKPVGINYQKQKEIKSQPSYPEQILVNKGNRLISASVKDILWLEAEGDYTKIHTSKETFLSNKGISELEQLLNTGLFIRVHRSAIVALLAIKEIHKDPSGPQIILHNGTLIKVSRSYTDVIRRLTY
jgi:two-component system LytT family response regulator